MSADFTVLSLQQFFRDPIIGEDVLEPPMENLASQNIRLALNMLGYDLPVNNRYDEELKEAVRSFQIANGHRFHDGLVGPGTRRLLTDKLVERVGEQAFHRMRKPIGAERAQPPQVFLSYSWKDTETVNKIDQWLRDHDIRVVRDNRDFVPGKPLPEAIIESVTRADKVIAIYSSNSKHRDWPSFEIRTAEEHEQLGKRNLLIYVILDETPLPKHDPNRIAIMAKGRKLHDVGEDLLLGIVGKKKEPPRYAYDENEEL